MLNSLPYSFLGLSIFTIALNGCIGTMFLRDVDITLPFPSLHSVPDNQDKENFSEIIMLMKEKEEENKKHIIENQQLRREYGLSTEVKKSSSLILGKKKIKN